MDIIYNTKLFEKAKKRRMNLNFIRLKQNKKFIKFIDLNQHLSHN